MKPSLVIKKWKPTSKPRFVLLENSRALLAGIEHHDLDSICDLAAIYAHGEIKKAKDAESREWYSKILWILNSLKESRNKEFDKTYSPKREITLIERLRIRAKEREWWKKFYAGIRKNIQ